MWQITTYSSYWNLFPALPGIPFGFSKSKNPVLDLCSRTVCDLHPKFWTDVKVFSVLNLEAL